MLCWRGSAFPSWPLLEDDVCAQCGIVEGGWRKDGAGAGVGREREARNASTPLTDSRRTCRCVDARRGPWGVGCEMVKLLSRSPGLDLRV